MMRSSISRLAAIGLTALLAAACSSTKPSGESAGGPSGPYKIGKPYQVFGVWYYPQEDWSYDETGIASFYGGETTGVNFHGRNTANGERYDMNTLTAAHKTLPLPSLVKVTNLENGREMVLRVNDRGPFVRGRIIDVSRRSAQLLGFHGQGLARVRVQIMADESKALKEALLQGRPAPGEAPVMVAAAPRGSVASDALPPPAGARAEVATPAPQLPPPAQTVATPVRRAEPIQVTPAPPMPAVEAAAPAAPIRAAPPLPAPSAAVVQAPVRPTSLYVQAGAFTNVTNADRQGARLAQFGHTKVIPAKVNGLDIYRVRVGPVGTVEQADLLLAQVARVAPEAQIIVEVQGAPDSRSIRR